MFFFYDYRLHMKLFYIYCIILLDSVYGLHNILTYQKNQLYLVNKSRIVIFFKIKSKINYIDFYKFFLEFLLELLLETNQYMIFKSQLNLLICNQLIYWIIHFMEQEQSKSFFIEIPLNPQNYLKDFKSIYDSFNLLSWLHSNYRCRIPYYTQTQNAKYYYANLEVSFSRGMQAININLSKIKKNEELKIVIDYIETKITLISKQKIQLDDNQMNEFLTINQFIKIKLQQVTSKKVLNDFSVQITVKNQKMNIQIGKEKIIQKNGFTIKSQNLFITVIDTRIQINVTYKAIKIYRSMIKIGLLEEKILEKQNQKPKVKNKKKKQQILNKKIKKIFYIKQFDNFDFEKIIGISEDFQNQKINKKDFLSQVQKILKYLEDNVRKYQGQTIITLTKMIKPDLLKIKIQNAKNQHLKILNIIRTNIDNYYHQILQRELNRKENIIVASFQLYKNILYIQIDDVKDFIKIKLLNSDCILKPEQDTLFKSDPQNKILEYHYIEPQSIKNKTFNQLHLNLALQGGGAKGIAYIGVIQALQNIYKNNIPIKSVIGSSAGGILALAISAKINSKFIQEKILPGLGKIPQVDKIPYQTNPSKEKVEGYFNILRNFLNKFGLIQASLFDHLYQKITPKLLSRLVMFFLKKDGFQGISQLYSYIDHNNQADRFINLRGILQGKMMTGESIRKLSQLVLIEYFQKCKQLEIKQDQRQKKASTLTMKQYYQMTGVQFTCTSVDIDDRILRFFNHKTTPNLPVCMAVQMTGSFPIAFQSQKWKQQWGKYYIHYNNIRREVDITGHNFTDGGMLSNFPIKYLDNQLIRSKYFSHKANSYTKLFGFGFNYINQQVQHKLQTKQLFEELNTIFGISISDNSSIIKKLSNPRFIKNSLSALIQKGLNRWRSYDGDYDLQNIPILSFSKRLLFTFRNSDDNLNQQIFRQQIFFFKESSNYTVQNRNEKKGSVIKKKIISLKTKIEQLKAKYIQKNLFQMQLENLKNLSENQKEDQIKTKIFQVFRLHHQFLYTNINIRGKKKDISYQLNKIENQVKFFFLKNQSKDWKQISNIQQYMTKQKKDFKDSYNYEKQKIIFRINSILSLINSIKLINNNQVQQLSQQDSERLIKISTQINKTYSVARFHGTLLKEIEGLVEGDDKILDIESQINFLKNQKKIDQYIINNYYSQIQRYTPLQRRNLKLHLVFQGTTKFNKKYFYSYERTIQNFYKLSFKQDQKIDIGAISTTLGSSYLAFLLCLKLPRQEILSEVQGIFDIYQFYYDIEEKLKDGKYFTLPETDIRKFLDIIWNDRNKNNIMNDLQKYAKDPNGKISLDQIEQNTQKQKQVIMQGFNKMLKYIIETKIELLNETDQIKKKQHLKQKFSLADLKQLNQHKSKKTFEQLKAIVDKFDNQVNYLIFQSSEKQSFFRIHQYVKNQNKNIQQKVWKQLLISRFINVNKIKKNVMRILQKYQLPTDLTLKEFYQICQKKILFTVISIDTKKERLTFINKNTYPYMPVWAALTIAMTRLLYCKPIHNKRQWATTIPSNQKQRISTSNFQINRDYIPTSFASSYLFSTINLEYLTNNKIVQQFFKRDDDQKYQKYIYMTFGYIEQQQLNKSEKLEKAEKNIFNFLPKAKFFGPLQLIKIFSNIGNILRTQPFQEKKKIIQIYINSHDKLINHTYKKQTLLLPVYLSTLDFLKLRDKIFIQNTIQQSKYYSLERLVFQWGSKFQTYIKINTSGYKKIKYQFLSKQLSQYDFNHNYKIQYQIGNNKSDMNDYQNVENNQIILQSDQFNDDKHLLLLFQYAGQHQITNRQYILSFTPIPNQFQIVIKIQFNSNYDRTKAIKNQNNDKIVENLRIQTITRLKTAISTKVYKNHQIPNPLFQCKMPQCNQKLIIDNQYPKIDEVSKDKLNNLQCSYKKFCLNIKLDRYFKCKNSHIGCLPCFKYQMLSNIKNKLVCYKGHQIIVNIKQVGKVSYICDFCLKIVQDSFLDRFCDIVICSRCAFEFM